MVRSSFAILFFIKDSRVRKDGTTSIEVVLTMEFLKLLIGGLSIPSDY